MWMLSINCVLADITNKLRVAESYGTCDERWKDLLHIIGRYQWVYNNAWDCLTDCQKKDVEVFLKTNFNLTSYSTCEDITDDCFSTPNPDNDDCSGAYLITYPDNTTYTTYILNQTNTYTCGVIDYPTDSGISLPISWDVTSSGDTWYYFDTGTSIISNPYIHIYNGTMKAPQVAIYEGPSCGSLNLIEDNAENETRTDVTIRPTLEQATTYFIRVSSGGSAGGLANTGTFDIAVSLHALI